MAQTVKMKMVTNWYQQETSSAILTSTAEFMDISVCKIRGFFNRTSVRKTKVVLQKTFNLLTPLLTEGYPRSRDCRETAMGQRMAVTFEEGLLLFTQRHGCRSAKQTISAGFYAQIQT